MNPGEVRHPQRGCAGRKIKRHCCKPAAAAALSLSLSLSSNVSYCSHIRIAFEAVNVYEMYILKAL
jgi:hypothetical protein